MSTAATSNKFPWYIFRSVAGLVTAYAIGYNLIHHVQHDQWWFPFGLIVVAVLTMIFEGIYDEPLPGIAIGPLNMSNVSCLMVGVGVPTTALICTIVRGGWYWIAGAVALVIVNTVIYVFFRQRGLPATIVAALLLVLAVA